MAKSKNTDPKQKKLRYVASVPRYSASDMMQGMYWLLMDDNPKLSHLKGRLNENQKKALLAINEKVWKLEDQINRTEDRNEIRKLRTEIQNLAPEYGKKLKEFGIKEKDWADTTFRREFERTKSFFEDAYPGGIDYREIDHTGMSSVEDAFKDLGSSEIYLSMHNETGRYDKEGQMFEQPLGDVIQAMNKGGAGPQTVCRSGACYGEFAGKKIGEMRKDDNPDNDFLGSYESNSDRYFYGVDMKKYQDWKKANPDVPITDEVMDQVVHGMRDFKERYGKLSDDLMYRLDNAPPKVNNL